MRIEYESELEQRFPAVKWREPLPVRSIENGKMISRLACRFCIAIYGLKGSELKQLPETPEEFATHLKESHP